MLRSGSHQVCFLTAIVLSGCGGAEPSPRLAAPTNSGGALSHSDQSPESGSSAGDQAPEVAIATPQAPVDPFGPGYPGADAHASGEFGRVGSLNWGTWVHPKPDSRSLPMGGIRIGDSLQVTGPAVRSGLGRCSEYLPVERGFVCKGKRSTVDMVGAFMQAHRYSKPAAGAFPYEYAFSVGAPMLTRIPAAGDERYRKTGDRDYKKLRGWAVGHDELAEGSPIEANGPIPEFLQNGGHTPTSFSNNPHTYFKKIPKGSMLAYTRAFEAEGTTWVLSTNMTIVPAEGLKRFRRSEFRGIELGQGESAQQLPIAWMRKKSQSKWRLTDEGWAETGESWPLRGHVALTGVEVKHEKRRFLETREPGVYILSSDATVAKRRKKLPWAVRKHPDKKWIHVRVTQGTLTLYRGETPVFTTLMSPGKDGATPYGTFEIESKHHVSTMTTEMGEPRKFWIADVPWTQYFKRPYAIHGAYWHENFGEKMSGGCVNLSPIDAEFVFNWTGPDLPAGWGMAQAYTMGGGTLVLIEG